MVSLFENWRIQIRKGYLELVILSLIQQSGRLYGFDLLSRLESLTAAIKEGTLYPLLNRMTADGVLEATWETEGLKGHPRKFYSLTATGRALLAEMRAEFQRMIEVLHRTQGEKP